jgi:hypothetical protein
MKQPFKTLIFFIVLLAAASGIAQAHDLDPASCCKLTKNYRGTECNPCPACTAASKKEQEAKKTEDKRRSDAILAANNAKLAELKRQSDVKKAEALKNAHSGELVINAQVPSTKPKAAPKAVPPKKALKTTDDVIFAKGEGSRQLYGKSAPFFNEKDEIITQSADWSATYTVRDISFTENAPKNFGIARIGDHNFNWREYSFNLVGSTGKYLLEDNDITSICHLRNNWLLIACRPGNFYLLNMQTQEKINLPFFGKQANHGYQNFPPIFSDKVIMNTERPEISEHMIDESRMVKKSMMRYFPNEVNENVLSRYSFVLFQTDFRETLNIITNANFDWVSRIEMYGITENGEMETIRIK